MSKLTMPLELRITWAIIAVQLVLIGIMLVVPFGFDHPRGYLRLDFGDALAVLAVYGLTLLCGLVRTAIHRQWKLLVLQLLMLVVSYGVAVNLGV